jgi:anti-sigma regulatory factor (Ser/Thr protein kinase)
MDSDDPEPDGSGLELRLKPRTDAAAEAREAIRERLSASLAAPTLDDLLTVVTELVTNSVRHGPGAPIDVRVEVAADGAVRGAVADQGEGKVAIRETRTPGTGGIGLRLVDSIAARWGVHEGSTHVWFELRAPTAGLEARRSP